MTGSYSLRAYVFTEEMREVLILVEHLIHDIRVTISPSALSPHNYMFFSHYSTLLKNNDNRKSQNNTTTERLNIYNGYIRGGPIIGISSIRAMV